MQNPHNAPDRALTICFIEKEHFVFMSFWVLFSVFLFCFRHYEKQQGTSLHIKEPQVTSCTSKDKKSAKNFKPDTNLCLVVAALHFGLTA